MEADTGPEADAAPHGMARYARQVRFPAWGTAGQQRLRSRTCLIVGCGALGSVQANLLTRAGIGRLRLVDRDLVEWTNLQRQDLFAEADAKAGTPKALAAAHALRRINSDVQVEPVVADLTRHNVLELLREVDLILDGTDNFETRFLLNDVACQSKIPWVFGGCVASEGQVLAIFPGRSPCLQCLLPDGPPAAGAQATCDTAGILNVASHWVATLQAAEAYRYLVSPVPPPLPRLLAIDAWDLSFRALDVSGLRANRVCPCCDQGEYAWLSGARGGQATVLCGRNAVQITPERGDAAAPISLAALARNLQGLGDVAANDIFVRFRQEGLIVTIFHDGRAIVQGTEDLALAKSVCARLLGSQ